MSAAGPHPNQGQGAAQAPALTMFACPRHAGGLRLTTAACASMWRSHQGDRHSHCCGCALGAEHAGEAAPPPPPDDSCAWCRRRYLRLVFGCLCISCYNRVREASRGTDRRGRRPGALDRLRLYRVADAPGTGGT